MHRGDGGHQVKINNWGKICKIIDEKICYSSAYNTSASLAASYGSAVLDPLLQASSLASAASAQTTSGEIKHGIII